MAQRLKTTKIYIGRVQIDLLKRKIISAFIGFYFFSPTFMDRVQLEI